MTTIFNVLECFSVAIQFPQLNLIVVLVSLNEQNSTFIENKLTGCVNLISNDKTSFDVQEMDEELGPVRAQAAYISLLQRDYESASNSFATLLGQPISTALNAVVTNNLLCLRARQSEASRV